MRTVLVMPSLNLTNSTSPGPVFHSGFRAKIRARAEVSELALSYESGIVRNAGGGAPPFEIAEADMVDHDGGSDHCI